MDFNVYKSVLVLISFCAHVKYILGAGDADIFNTRVQINPPSAVKGQTVTFQCDFTLVDERDLHLLYWETTNGERLFTYNNEKKEPTEHQKYEEKIISTEYIENVQGGGEWDRRHILKMEVDNCDRATYRCLVLNQEVFSEGSDQQTLEITASLPEPELCLKIDGQGECVDISNPVYQQNRTTCTVSCKVTKSSVEPDMELTKNGVKVGNPAEIEGLDGCLHNGVLESGEQVIEAGEETTFKCLVDYGGTEKFSQASITFITPPPTTPDGTSKSSSASTGTTVGIVIGVLVIIVVGVILFVIYWRKRKQENSPSRKYKVEKAPPSDVQIIHPHTNDPKDNDYPVKDV